MIRELPVVASLNDPDYPSCDGKPLSDNTKQYEWIATIKSGLDGLFLDDPNVFISADLLWYPVEGEPKIRTAPDVMVVFGRPIGHRGAYIQFREGGVTPRVVFEVLSPSNRAGEMRRKLAFYDHYGAEEYYIFDPDHARHAGYIRRDGGPLERLPALHGWTSPSLGIRFHLVGEDRKVFGPDGRAFPNTVDSLKARRALEALVESTRDEADRLGAEVEAERARAERARAEVEAERARAERALAEVEQLRERLRALGMEPEG